MQKPEVWLMHLQGRPNGCRARVCTGTVGEGKGELGLLGTAWLVSVQKHHGKPHLLVSEQGAVEMMAPGEVILSSRSRQG